jgi:hypothetical protein
MSDDYKQGYRDGFKDGFIAASKEDTLPWDTGNRDTIKLKDVTWDTSCPKCLMTFKSATGYVCAFINCPLQPKVT